MRGLPESASAFSALSASVALAGALVEAGAFVVAGAAGVSGARSVLGLAAGWAEELADFFAGIGLEFHVGAPGH